MKKKILFVMIFFLSIMLSAQEIADPPTAPAPAINYIPGEGGIWLPSIGDMNVLIIFAEFQDDQYKVDNPRWEKGQPPANMSGWVDETWSSNPTQGSFTHYFNSMSGNKFHFTGKVIHKITSHTRYYYESHGMKRYKIHKEMLEEIDVERDFGEFDNWDFVENYNHGNNPDGVVDMVMIIWRNIHSDSSFYSDKFSIYCSGHLGEFGQGNVDVDGGNRTIQMYYGSDPFGSGVTVSHYLDRDPFQDALHEFAHYLLGHNDMHNGFAFWGMLCAWGTRAYTANAFERYQLQWITDSLSYTIDGTTTSQFSQTFNLTIL